MANNVGLILLDCADILRSISALVMEEETHVPVDRRPDFERQIATQVSEITTCLRSAMDDFGRDVRDYSTRSWADSKRRWGPLRIESERLSRQAGLLKPIDQREMLATLGWMAHQGKAEELQALQRIRTVSAPDSDAKLMELAEARITQRLSGSSQKVISYPESEQAGSGSWSDLELLLKAYRTQLDPDWKTSLEQVIAQVHLSGIQERDTREPRGSFSTPAPSRLPISLAADVIKVLLDALVDRSPTIRKEAAGALGEWGDVTTVESLVRMLNGPDSDPDEGVRRACAGALGVIGGPEAVVALCAAAERDASKAVRQDALYALSNLLSNLSDWPTTEIATSDPQVEAVIQTMQRISSNPQEDEALRQKAAIVLHLLTKTT